MGIDRIIYVRAKHLSTQNRKRYHYSLSIWFEMVVSTFVVQPAIPRIRIFISLFLHPVKRLLLTVRSLVVKSGLYSAINVMAADVICFHVHSSRIHE